MELNHISSEAEARVLRNVEFVSDLVAASCMGAGPMGELPKLSETKALQVADHSIAAALCLMLDDGQTLRVQAMAVAALRRHVLALPESVELLIKTQARLDKEAADAEETMRDELAYDLRNAMGVTEAALPVRA